MLAAFSLDTTSLPKPASGYQYFLSTQLDPSASNTDLVVNYAAVPEPTAMLLVAGPQNVVRFARFNIGR